MKLFLSSFLLLLMFNNSAFASQILVAKTSIAINGNQIGAPILKLEPGIETSVSVKDTYDLSLSAIDAGDDQVRINIKLTADGVTQSPIMQVKYGEEASFEAHGMFFSVLIIKEST